MTVFMGHLEKMPGRKSHSNIELKETKNGLQGQSLVFLDARQKGTVKETETVIHGRKVQFDLQIFIFYSLQKTSKAIYS